MKRYGVMGNPIAHSLSPQIHQHFASQLGLSIHYEKILVPVDGFETAVMHFFNEQAGSGLNITLPFKERAFAMADVLSERCLLARAANTLWFLNGKCHADNTDGVGFIRDMAQHLSLTDKRIVLLGAGGAARGIIGEIINARPKSLIIANRHVERGRQLASLFPPSLAYELDALTEPCDVVINATSANFQSTPFPIPKGLLDNKPFCYDLSYNLKHPTSFLEWALAHGLQGVDGIGMLIQQAAEAFTIWHGVAPDTTYATVISALQAQ